MATVAELRAAEREWLLAPDNTPEEVAAWNRLYLLAVGEPPPDSRNATKEEEAPVMLP